jgi:hypothetical protein
LRYVQSVRLDVHCARAFRGPYQPHLSPGGLLVAAPVPLDHADARVYYLCGVTSPYSWDDNLHVAFAYSPGTTLDVREHGVQARIANAVRLPIPPSRPRPDLPFGHLPSYYTCRNWQFATSFAGLVLSSPSPANVDLLALPV